MLPLNLGGKTPILKHGCGLVTGISGVQQKMFLKWSPRQPE
jgi:hypothetical protein